MRRNRRHEARELWRVQRCLRKKFVRKRGCGIRAAPKRGDPRSGPPPNWRTAAGATILAVRRDSTAVERSPPIEPKELKNDHQGWRPDAKRHVHAHGREGPGAHDH